MSIGRMLNHRVSIVRRTGSTLDDYGQPITTEGVIASDVAAGIQSKRIREVVLVSQQGAVVGDWTIFMGNRDITEGDTIRHTAALCPNPGGADLADADWNVTGVRPDPSGRHHLEIDARLVRTDVAIIEAVPSGS